MYYQIVLDTFNITQYKGQSVEQRCWGTFVLCGTNVPTVTDEALQLVWERKAYHCLGTRQRIHCSPYFGFVSKWYIHNKVYIWLITLICNRYTVGSFQGVSNFFRRPTKLYYFRFGMLNRQLQHFGCRASLNVHPHDELSDHLWINYFWFLHPTIYISCFSLKSYICVKNKCNVRVQFALHKEPTKFAWTSVASRFMVLERKLHISCSTVTSGTEPIRLWPLSKINISDKQLRTHNEWYQN